jgi:hypothetical protein
MALDGWRSNTSGMKTQFSRHPSIYVRRKLPSQEKPLATDNQDISPPVWDAHPHRDALDSAVLTCDELLVSSTLIDESSLTISSVLACNDLNQETADCRVYTADVVGDVGLEGVKGVIVV